MFNNGNERSGFPELDWKIYEEIAKMLKTKYGISIVDYGENFRILGKLGFKHQIDVMTEKIVDDRAFRTAIECKYIKMRVITDILIKLERKVAYANIASGIIIRKSV